MVIYPSLYEGFGLPVLEAMVFNTPVITSMAASLLKLEDKHVYTLIQILKLNFLKNSSLYYDDDLRKN